MVQPRRIKPRARGTSHPPTPATSQVALPLVWAVVPEKLWSPQAPCWAGLGRDVWALRGVSFLLKGATREGTDVLSIGRDHIQMSSSWPLRGSPA